MDLLPVYDCLTSWTGNAENTGNVGLLNIDRKVILVNIIFDLVSKIHILKSCQVYGANFP